MKSVVRSLASEDGKQRLDIFDNGNGFYSFEETCEAVEDIPDYGLLNFQKIVFESGLYERLEEAERAAMTRATWLGPRTPPKKKRRSARKSTARPWPLEGPESQFFTVPTG
jgi:hypothetical protein